MKITETIKRECCEARDLLEYKGILASDTGCEGSYRKKIYFCKYCGELWTIESVNDGGGGSDPKYVRMFEGKTAQKAFMDLVKHGGAWVSSNECSIVEIAAARAQERWFQIESLGFVRRPSEGEGADRASRMMAAR